MHRPSAELNLCVNSGFMPYNFETIRLDLGRRDLGHDSGYRDNFALASE